MAIENSGKTGINEAKVNIEGGVGKVLFDYFNNPAHRLGRNRNISALPDAVYKVVSIGLTDQGKYLILVDKIDPTIDTDEQSAIDYETGRKRQLSNKTKLIGGVDIVYDIAPLRTAPGIESKRTGASHIISDFYDFN